MIRIVEIIDRRKVILFKHLTKGNTTILGMIIPKDIINKIAQYSEKDPLYIIENSRKYLVKTNSKIGILLRLCKVSREVEIS